MATTEELVLQYIGKLVKGTEFEGNTFLVGGATRDEVMGKTPKDIDLVISMPDGGIKFAEWITRKTMSYSHGANPLIFPRFGTAKFNLRGITVGEEDLSNIDIEVVMTRGEKYQAGNRKPEVVYAELKDDALRRDLTVNALYKDVVTGEIKDPTGRGLSDINNGIVRTPTDPNITFSEDPLRMLRAVRFAVKYNWKMSRSLVEAILKNADKLQTISKERIKEELNKILMTDRPDIGLRMLTNTGLNKHVIPELDMCKGVTQNAHHKDDVYDHILEVVKNTPMDLTARLASLFHDIGKPETRSVGPDGRVHFYKHEDVGAKMAMMIMQRLRYSLDETGAVAKIVEHHMDLKSAGNEGELVTDKSLRKFISNVGHNLVSALKTMHADNISHSEESSMPNQIKNIADKIVALKSAGASEKPKLPINGNDIMHALNMKPGPEVKNMLAAVLDAWYTNPEIDRDTALQIVKQLHAKKTDPAEVDVTKISKNILNMKIQNPYTNNQILVKTALGYDKTHPAYQAAQSLISQHRVH